MAPSLNEAAIRRQLPVDMTCHLLQGIDYTLIQAADAALVTSGTATLEMACLGVPMVVAYRGSSATWLQYQLMVRSGQFRHVSLPNIIAERDVVPERLQHAANPDTLAGDLIPLLADTPARQAQLDAFRDIRATLGDGHACERAATLVRQVGERAYFACPHPDMV